MAELFNEYKCPSCGGTMVFDAASGHLKCEYCGTEMAVEEAKRHYAAENQKVTTAGGGAASENDGNWGQDQGKMKAYRCQSCGAELVCDDTTAATSCPYCGNTAVMPQQFSGMQRPKYVIPFKVTKEAAVEKLSGYCKGKWLLPKAFKEGNHLEEVKGVYVPFWLYSGTVNAEIFYEAESDEVRNTPRERITITRHYEAHRKGTIDFDKIPADASSRMPDDLMDSIEPYDYREMRPFEMEYLPGYLADKYDVSAAESRERARKRAVGSAESMFKDTVTGYDRVHEIPKGKRMEFRNEKNEYAMMPVWMLTTNWNNQNFLFAVNGQTGQMTGNLPINRTKQVIVSILAALVAFLLGYAFFDSAFFGLVAAVIGVLIANGIMLSSMKPVAQKSQANQYVDKNAPDGGVRLSIRDDRFLRTTERRERKDDGHGGGPGGPGGGHGPGPGHGPGGGPGPRR